MFIKRVFITVSIILLFSCADPSMFEESGDDISIYTVKNGGLQEFGESVNVTLEYGKESPEFDTLEISLFSDAGINLFTETVSAAAIESKKSRAVKLPDDIGKGLYHLKLSLLKSGTPVKNETRSFFYDNDLYSLEGVRSYPPDPVPGEKIILKADYTAPLSSNPWFRWTVGQKTVSEGFASQNGNIAALDSLLSSGVVPVFVEMFPFKPSDSGFDDFLSFFNSETAVFVSEKNRERSNEFIDNSNYSMLFHFRGEITDEGFSARNNPANDNFSVKGRPDLDFRNSLYGYSFSREDSVTVPYIAYPFKNSLLAPSTFRIRMLPDTDNILPGDLGVKEFPVFLSGNNEDFSAEIGLKGSSGFYISLISGSRSFKGECEYFSRQGTEIIDLAVNFYPGPNSVYLVWMVNGRTLKVEKIPFAVSVTGSMNGFSRIGGADMLIDEAGVYAAGNDGDPSVDSTLFSSIMENKYNGDFAAAAGFDESVNKNISSGTGGFRYENGYLYLDPESSAAVFEDIEFNKPVEIKTGGKALLIIKDSSGNIVMESHVSEKNSVNFDSSLYGDNSIFDVFLANDSRNEILEIDNILILVNYPEENTL